MRPASSAFFVSALLALCDAALAFIPSSPLYRSPAVHTLRSRTVAPVLPSLLRTARRSAAPRWLAQEDDIKPEDRAYKIGQACDAEWIGDNGWYAAEIFGYWKEGQYDIKWADPQGMAPTQATHPNAIRPFDARSYYRFGLNAMDQEDFDSAYLAFRTVYKLVGAFGDTEKHIATLIKQPSVVQIAAQRGDGELLAELGESLESGTSTRPARSSVVRTEATGEGGGDAAAAQEVEEDQDQGIFSEAEMEDLRQEARDEARVQHMYSQFNVFRSSEVGQWHQNWIDYKIDNGQLIEDTSSEKLLTLTGELDDEDQPFFTIAEESDGAVTEKPGAFYPMAQSSWFVGNAFTYATVEEVDGQRRLALEVGIRHATCRASCVFRYAAGVKDASWELATVSVGRSKLDAYPSPAEDSALYRKEKGVVVGQTLELAGPADKFSTGLMPRPQSDDIFSLAVEGGIVVTAPASLASRNDEVPSPCEVCLEWTTPSTPGIAWDGKDRIIPAMTYRVARIFKGVTINVDMLSLMESTVRE